LLVHRALDCQLHGDIKSAPEGFILDTQELTEIGEHITFTEERADDAERELKTVLILQMLSDKIGEELDCVVTGLTNFGVFVQSRKLGVEGLVQLTDLGPDQWRYDAKAGCIIGRHSGRLVYLGQPMKVRIVSVNVSARQLNVAPLVPVLSAGTTAKTPARRGKHAKSRRAGSGKFANRRKQKKGKRRR
jgi:ribonuclease R